MRDFWRTFWTVGIGFAAGVFVAKAHADELDKALPRDKSEPVIVRDANTGKQYGVWNHGNGFFTVQPQGLRQPGDTRHVFIQRDREVVTVREAPSTFKAGGKR